MADERSRRSLPALGAFVLIALGAGFVGSQLQGDALDSWYRELDRPAFTPPDWVFAPVWTILYVLIGVAAWLDWRAQAGSSRARLALAVFAIQLVLNAAWSGVFFGLRSPEWALLVIGLLAASIVAWIALTWRPARTAAYLLLPYLAWVSFATVLNASIAMMN
jgi:translocator protein